MVTWSPISKTSPGLGDGPDCPTGGASEENVGTSAERQPVNTKLAARAMQAASREQTSAKFSLGKGKVCHTIERAHDQLRRKMVFLSLFLDHFEKKSHALQKDLGHGPLDLKTLALHMLSEPDLPELAVEEWQAERLILLMRSMVLQPNSWFQGQIEPRWPSFILLSCLVEPAIAKHKQVRRLLRVRNWKEKI